MGHGTAKAGNPGLGDGIVVGDGARGQPVFEERTLGVRQHQLQGLAALVVGVVQEGEGDRLAGLARSEGERAARRRVVQPGRRRAVVRCPVHIHPPRCGRRERYGERDRTRGLRRRGIGDTEGRPCGLRPAGRAAARAAAQTGLPRVRPPARPGRVPCANTHGVGVGVDAALAVPLRPHVAGNAKTRPHTVPRCPPAPAGAGVVVGHVVAGGPGRGVPLHRETGPVVPHTDVGHRVRRPGLVHRRTPLARRLGHDAAHAQVEAVGAPVAVGGRLDGVRPRIERRRQQCVAVVAPVVVLVEHPAAPPSARTQVQVVVHGGRQRNAHRRTTAQGEGVVACVTSRARRGIAALAVPVPGDGAVPGEPLHAGIADRRRGRGRHAGRRRVPPCARTVGILRPHPHGDGRAAGDAVPVLARIAAVAGDRHARARVVPRRPCGPAAAGVVVGHVVAGGPHRGVPAHRETAPAAGDADVLHRRRQARHRDRPADPGARRAPPLIGSKAGPAPPDRPDPGRHAVAGLRIPAGARPRAPQVMVVIAKGDMALIHRALEVEAQECIRLGVVPGEGDGTGRRAGLAQVGGHRRRSRVRTHKIGRDPLWRVGSCPEVFRRRKDGRLVLAQ